MALISNVAAPASRGGLKNGNSDNTELFLKVFSGEILTAFETNNVMKELHTVRTIQSGKSAQFPVTGIAEAAYHAAGESILEKTSTANGTEAKYLSDIKKTEQTIFIDDMLIASTFLANIDELMTHYDLRSVYAAELGKALAKRFDIATMKTLFSAAKNGVANISGDTAVGATILGATKTTADVVNSLFSVATALDEQEAPSEGRFAILAPKTYNQLLTSDNTAISKDYGTGGNVAAGLVPMVAGISLYKSNHLATIAALGSSGDATGVTTGDGSASVKNDVTGATAGSGSGYNADFSGLLKFDQENSTNVAGSEQYGILAGTKEAIGTVKLLDLATESDYQIERQGTLFVAKYAMGHGVLRPECSVVVEVD